MIQRLSESRLLSQLDGMETLAPWCMHPDEIPAAQRRQATDRTVDRMARFAEHARCLGLATAIRGARFVAEQEG
jgi:hypothetical protein